MSEYTATIRWQRHENESYIDNQYSREHEWLFDGGVVVPASSSPHVVPLPFSVEENVDPEEAFIAALSSCHMLFFLSIAAKKGFVIDEYTDAAIGLMEKDSDNKISITRVILRPEIKFAVDNKPDCTMLEKMHHQSHEQCFIANSVKTEVVTEIVDSII